jgi:moderate conductance mechanosensitive channel
MKNFIWALAVATGFLLSSNGAAVAQLAQAAQFEKSQNNATQLQSIIEQAQQNGSTVIVIGTPNSKMSPGISNTSDMKEMEKRAMEARKNLRAIISNAPQIINQLTTAIQVKDKNGSSNWPLWALGLTLLYLLVGYAIEYLFHGWSRPHFAYFCKADPETRSEKIAYLLFRGVMQAMALFIQGGTAVILVFSFDSGLEHVRTLQFTVIVGIFGYRLAAVFFQNLLAYDTSPHRLLTLNDAQALRLNNSALVFVGFLALAIGISVWVGTLGLDLKSEQFFMIFFSLAAMIVEAIIVFLRRADVASILLGPGDLDAKWKPRIFIARMWHVIAILYFVVSFAVTAIRISLEQPNAMGLTNIPLLALVCGITLYGAALLAIEWTFEHRGKKITPLPELVGESPDDEIMETSYDDRPLVPQKSYQSLVEKAAGILVSALMIWWVFLRWGVNLSEPGSVLNDLWEVMLILFMSYLAYESVKIGIDRKIEEEGGDMDFTPGDEGGAAGASRLATLLPLFRNFLLIVIVVLSSMIVLSELGVDIAPLFAGAGVVGLAIGFGAQTLIRDIFSGAFFLMDDAFRKGEYINIGDVKGTVEKISIRSMQLRHHLGPLNTVPFGDIKHLTNFSRDWVMMKLPLRLTYDTDVEKVRKLIKNLGLELLEHPEVGENFIQPLKSQGVFKMEDSAMIIRVKFMTKPGDQFVIRKLVYAKIRELFEDNGIKFAHREVTVRVADDTQSQRLTEQEKKAIGGAVQPAIEDDPGRLSATEDR